VIFYELLFFSCVQERGAVLHGLFVFSGVQEVASLSFTDGFLFYGVLSINLRQACANRASQAGAMSHKTSVYHYCR